jgi:AcrR family transcriptional regulator
MVAVPVMSVRISPLSEQLLEARSTVGSLSPAEAALLTDPTVSPKRRPNFLAPAPDIAQTVQRYVHFSFVTARPRETTAMRPHGRARGVGSETIAPIADRQAARKAHTRDAIADAMLDLVVDGSLRPTAKEIAARAGVSLRSVYVHFDDLEDLFCVAAKRHYARVALMLAPIPDAGSGRQRATAFVGQRVELYAKIGRVSRATQLQAPSSPTLARIVREAQARSRREIERVFAAELNAMPERERKRRAGIIDVMTSSHAWETLTASHGLSVADVLESMVEAIVLELGSGS